MTDEPRHGEQLWRVAKKQRGRDGHPPTFETPDDLLDAAYAYLEWVDANPLYEFKAFSTGQVLRVPKMRYPTIEGLCLHMGIVSRTWRSWRTPDHPLGDAVERVQALLVQQRMEGGAAGFFNPLIVARDLGLKDRSEQKRDVTVNVVDTYDDAGSDPE